MEILFSWKPYQKQFWYGFFFIKKLELLKLLLDNMRLKQPNKWENKNLLYLLLHYKMDYQTCKLF